MNKLVLYIGGRNTYEKHNHYLRCLFLFGIAFSKNYFHSGYYNKEKYNYLKNSENLLDINIIYKYI